MNRENSQNRSGDILIVDDSRSSLDFLADLIEFAGYTARKVQHGELALLSAQADPPDLILLDIRMRGMNGYQVCSQLKADRRTSDIPVIFLSALDDTEAKLKGFELGAADYIIKPYQVEEVLARIRTQLELRRLRLNLEEQVTLRTRQLEAEVVERVQATQELLESRQKLRELSWHIEEMREEERKHIARELHDELGQVLTVLRIDLVQLASQGDLPVQEFRNKLQAAIGVLDQVADTTRSISENLRPGMLDMLGLAAATEHHVEKFIAATQLRCKVAMNREEFDIHPNVATALFRILQESLTNVARHANANEIEVRLAELNDQMILVVQDDGCGIPENPSDRRRGFGMMGMQERVELLGGQFLLESSPGSGTRIEVSIPLKLTEAAQ